ncbi:hypothetical protein PLESTB_000994000 [Pleodorina starrii]|uniref:HECT-type E3 ubiquitin transferase n=1 Tax=Pleodorina starrii TaxID=330485 RepID=A0A9W6F442_9CHLO|nr:hypothetical protein PLESTM_001853000 [Pleodorina starrii]GLC55499.1 hypothetical protein PLESTB_000994000 [Pleodorina starrii]GLC76380.1 hypothetical protein PLESTF_001774200 [Pleodorina starrii]
MSSRVAEADDHDKDLDRTTKMARVGRKYAVLFELAALAGSETPPEDWASRLLRLMSSAGWADPSFLEELSESGLVRGMCRALPVLRANAANRATASSVQDLADLEESMRKLRHELALAEKRLPSHGVLGSGGSSFYTTWASVGHVCTLMLQALTYGVAVGQNPTASNARASPAPMDAAKGANNSATSPVPAGGAPGGSAATPQPSGPGELPDAQTADSTSPAATPAAAAAGPSGASTPRGAAPMKPPGGGAALSPGTGTPGGGGSTPALATEGSVLKLLGNKHVVAHAKEVMRVVPEPYISTLARILLNHISTEMKATQAGLTHILQILQGDPAATSPAPSTLPKAWFATAALLTAYSDALQASLRLTTGAGAAAATAAAPTAAESPATSVLTEGRASDEANGGQAAGASAEGADASAPSDAAAPPSSGPAAGSAGADGDVEMADAPAGAAPAAEGGEHVAGPAPAEKRPAGLPSGSAPGSSAASASASAPSTPPARKGAGGVKSDSAVVSPSGAAAAAAAAAGATAVAAEDDPRVALVQLLQSVASALCEAVTGAHGVGRIALLLRGEVTVKYPNAAAYMPAALTINELMGHLDGLACVATALGASESIRPSVTSLLTGQAMKELLGAGKVYVTTVIAAGALTRDLAIDAVIPQSLRQGYMAAVLTPLETGALLNERRAPQVLAYRNSITESSYYQVMDAEALPYGVNVRFEDEQEAEGMGVVREWLSQIAADIFSPERGLFVRGAADKRVVHPATHSRLQEDYLGYMRFAGRIVGLALRANVPLGVVLSTGLFNYLTGRRATLQDLQQIDPQVYTTCQNILSSPGVDALELFHVWHTSAAGGGGGGSAGGSSAGSAGGGGEQEQELLPGGAALLVTDANKAEYVALLAHHVVVTVVEEQCAAFLTGVRDTAHHLPDDCRLRRAFLTPLLLEDLNRITAGESTLDPADWARHTDVAGFDGPEERGSVDMFWQLVSEYSLEDRQRLLQFWTAMTHLPSGGFKALNQRLQIMKLGPPASRPAGGEPTAGGPGAAAPAAAMATAAGHGPSADGAGPHSHRIDGDGLEVDEADDQEQSDGMEELSEDAEPQGTPTQPQQQQQGGGGGAAAAHAEAPTAGGGGADGSFRGAGRGDAAPAAEADLSGAERAGGGEAAAAAGAAGGGSAAAQAPFDGGAAHGGGDGVESEDDEGMPYGDEDEEAGGGEDAMDYGEEDEDEEFQRQLEMALALSLQDMPAEPAPGSSGGGSGGGAGSAEGGAGGAGGGGAGEGAAGGSGQGRAAPSGAAEQAEQGDGSARRAEPGEAADAAVGAVPGAQGGGDVAGSANRPVAEAAAASQADHQRAEGAEGASPPPPACGASGSGGEGGTAATRPEAAGDFGGDVAGETGCAPAAADGVGSEAAAAAADTAAGEAGTSNAGGEGPVARDASELQQHTEAGGAAASERPSGSGPADPMDTAGAQEAVPTQSAAQGAAAGSGEAAGEGAGPAAPPAANGSDDAAGGRGAAQTWPAANGQLGRGDAEHQQQPHGQAHGQQQAQESEQPQGQEEGQERAGGERWQDQAAAPRGEATREQGGLGSTAVPAAGAEGVAGGGAWGGAALTSSQSASRALPLLPQARTCFLQLNLPVYGSLEDMRRAFAIALDNMSFGLH